LFGNASDRFCCIAQTTNTPWLNHKNRGGIKHTTPNIHNFKKFRRKERGLIGSSGSSVEADLGKLFYITEAVKGDRGTLSTDLTFSWEIEKQTVRKHLLWDTECMVLKQKNVTSKKICSTNFLNSNVIDKHFETGYLFDMETFDFYDVCEKQGVKKYSCVRFVTDYVVPLGARKDEHLKDRIWDIKNPSFESLLPKDHYLDLDHLKKFVRLMLDVDFSFLFSLSMAGNEIGADIEENIERVNTYFNYFLEQFELKMQKADPTISSVKYRWPEPGQYHLVLHRLGDSEKKQKTTM
jgi:hypothetical protein